MRNLYRLSSILVLCLAFAPQGHRATAAETPAAPEEPLKPITLEEAVKQALKGNLSLDIDRFNKDAAREAVVVAESAYDPTLSAQARKNVLQETDPASTLTANSSDTARLSLAASQQIDTGATVTVTANNQRRSTNRFATFNPQYDSDVSLRIVQPLLNGAGPTANRATRRRARLGVDRSDIDFQSSAMDVVQSTELAFFNLAFSARQVDVQSTGLAAAEKFLDENEARQRAGLATELDVMQARVGVANRRAQLLTAQQGLRDNADQLLALLGNTTFQGRLEPQGLVFGEIEPVSIEASFSKALDFDPDIKSARIALQQLELDVKLAANNRLPTADLGGTLGYTGRADKFDTALDRLGGLDSYNWQLDLTVSIPWGMREGRSRLRTAKLSYAQQQARIRQLEQELLVRVRAAVRSVQTDTQAVDIAALSAEYSNREYQLEKAKFDAGLSTSRLVLEAQQRADEARVSETQSRIEAKQDISRLRRIEGTSLEHYGLDLSSDTLASKRGDAPASDE